MDGVVDDPVPLAEFDEAAPAHDRDPVAEVADHSDIVADEEIREPLALLEVLEQIDDLGLDRHVKSAGRLVTDNERRPERQGARDGDPLTLPTGKLMGVAPRRVAREAATVEQIEHGPLRFDAGPDDAVDAHRFGDDVGDSHTRVEARRGVLKNNLHAPTETAECAAARGEDVCVLETDRAGVRLDEPQDGAAERCFAGA